ncbi:MAG TPA: protein kinase [Pirellulales bacterium]|jgi:serine/threonine protein kinase|nr:protein kinase [Pirellulales bacterium]
MSSVPRFKVSLMSACPSDETLAVLLADGLAAPDRDALAEHVEGCAVCQKKLARLSEVSADPAWQRSADLEPLNETEQEIVRRLKRAWRSSPPFRSDPGDTTVFRARDAAAPPPTGEWPVVPGYEIVGVLGHGGMAVVFKALHLALQRVVALKMLKDWARAGEKELARFRAEADVIARLQHPNIVQIYDVGDVAGRPYFALEYIADGTLSQHLKGAPQPARLAAQFAEVLARAVQAAHTNGVVHRDLKPANILLVFDEATSARDDKATRPQDAIAAEGRLLTAAPKIADFGVAKCVSGDSKAPLAGTGLTVTGDLLGTPSYMAPEQAAPTGPPVGPAADIYALGAILYELLTGRPPFKGATLFDTVLQVLHSEPVSVTSLQPTVPRDLETICHKCLRKEPRHRYPSASELADDLQKFLRGKSIKARPRGAVEKVWRWVREHPVPTGLVAAGALTPLVALLILSLLSARLVRSSALDSAAQSAELLERANNQYSQIVQRVEQANYKVNKMVPPTPGTVPLSIPATFLHDVGEDLHRDSRTGIQVRQYSDNPFPWRVGGGPHDEFERLALERLVESRGRDTVHDFTELDGEPVVRYAQARIMKQSCVDCHNTHPFSTRKGWKVGDVRGVLEIIRPLKNDEARVTQALRLTFLLSAIGSGLLILGTVLAVWTRRRRRESEA